MTEGRRVEIPEHVLTDITALKEQYKALADTVSNGFKTLNEQFTRFNRFVDRVTEMQAEQRQHGSGIERAFTQIGHVEEELEEHVSAINAWKVEHVNENTKTEKTLSRWHGFATGVAMMTALSCGLLAWIGNDYLNQVRVEQQNIRHENTILRDRVRVLEIEAAREHRRNRDDNY